MKRIQSKKHKIGTYEVNKTSLSCFNDKRFVLDDDIHTLAYFRKKLKNWFSQRIIEIVKGDYKEEEILINKNKGTQIKKGSEK